MSNRLAAETSPYLHQHRDNPVDWYPWGDEAFERARAEGKPIFLSVGYSSCHWCHVMAHESFEDPATAEVMNRLFVNVKVDREERPDVDAVYMQAVQALTGRGGWPMSVWCTPDGRPFYGGTYFPDEDRHGMPAFTPRVRGRGRGLERAARRRRGAGRQAHRGDRRARPAPAPDAAGLDADDPRRPRVAQRALAVRPAVGRVRPRAEVPAGDDDRLPVPGARAHRRRGDSRDDHHHARRDGGRRHPRPARRRVRPLLDRRDVARPALREDALRQRAAHPRVPARLPRRPARRATAKSSRTSSATCCAISPIPTAASTRPRTPTPRASRASSTCGRRTRSASVCGDDADEVMRYYGVTRGRELRRSAHELPRQHPARRRAQRARDPKPSRVGARRCSSGASTACGPAATTRCSSDGTRCSSPRSPKRRAALDRDDWMARRPHERARSSCASSATPDGRFRRSWRAPYLAYAEDYAALLEALLTLAELDDIAWLADAARTSPTSCCASSSTHDGGGFFTTGHDAEPLVVRPKDVFDDATPSANSLAANGLLRLAHAHRRRPLRGAGRRDPRDARRPDDVAPHGLRVPARRARAARAHADRDRDRRRPGRPAHARAPRRGRRAGSSRRR